MSLRRRIWGISQQDCLASHEEELGSHDLMATGASKCNGSGYVSFYMAGMHGFGVTTARLLTLLNLRVEGTFSVALAFFD